MRLTEQEWRDLHKCPGCGHRLASHCGHDDWDTGCTRCDCPEEPTLRDTIGALIDTKIHDGLPSLSFAVGSIFLYGDNRQAPDEVAESSNEPPAHSLSVVDES